MIDNNSCLANGILDRILIFSQLKITTKYKIEELGIELEIEE